MRSFAWLSLLLLVGCSHAVKQVPSHEELAKWMKEGVVAPPPAASAAFAASGETSAPAVKKPVVLDSFDSRTIYLSLYLAASGIAVVVSALNVRRSMQVKNEVKKVKTALRTTKHD